MTESLNMVSNSGIKPRLKTWKGRLPVFAGMLLLFVSVFWLTMISRRMLTPLAALVVDEQYLSFGEVWEDPAFVWNLPIHNITQDAVEILSFVADCPCGKIEPPALQIPAQGTKTVRLTLDLRVPQSDLHPAKAHTDDESSSKSPNAKSPYRFTIKIIPVLPDGLDLRRVWEITGQVRQAAILLPNEVHFEDTLARSGPSAKKIVGLHTRVPVQQVVATCDRMVANLEVKRKQDDPKDFDIIVTPRMDMKAGPFKTKGRIELTLSTGEQLPPLLLPISGVLSEDIQVKPAAILAGVARVGTTVEESFLIFSASESPFDLEQMDSPSGSKLKIVRELSEASKQIKLTQEITQKGAQKSYLRFRVRYRNRESAKEIIVPVEYYGIDRDQ